MSALKADGRNVEAGVILGMTGFAIAEVEGDEREMELSIENLKITQSLAPGSRRLKAIIENLRERVNLRKGH
jgi:hypothetical protein